MADSVKIRITGDSTEYKDELKGIGKTTESMFKSMLTSQLLTRGIESAINGIRKLGKAAVSYGKQIVSTYADYEQLVGGVDTLFKESSAKVQQYASDAYKTTGLSANDYMESVTSFSASLISSLSGDTEKAAEKAQIAMVDMSDNANKMGTDMSAIQNAYQGFAKQNYTMLDNLKLGYGGTKEEMKRLLEDATKLSGIKYDISSYADVVDAIHVIQENMGIAGTTALEAEKTISGSISSLKAAFTNLLTGIGSDDADLDGLFDNVYTAIENVANNITPVIQRMVGKIPQIISNLKSTFLPKIQQIAQDIFNNLSNKMPQMIQNFMKKIPAMLSNVTSAIPALADSLFSLAGDAVEEVIANLPQLIPKLAQGISTLFTSAVKGAVELAKSALFGVVRAFGGDLEQQLKDLDPMQSISDEMAATIQARIDGTATVSDELKESIATCWEEIDKLLKGDTGVDETGEAALTNSASTGDASYVLEYVFDAWEVPEGAGDDAAASIAAAMAQIDGAVNGLITLDATQKANLQTMINNGATGDEIEAYLVDCNVDPTEAETIAETITGASNTINTAVEGLGLNPTQKATLIGQKASTKGMIKQLMLSMEMPEGVLDQVLTSYDTFNSSVGGKVAGAVTSLTETIEATLTDGEADTTEDVEALKKQVRTVYGSAVDAVNTVMAEEIAKLDVNSATYDADVQNIKDKGAEAIAELESQETAYIEFIDANAGRSTEIVTQNLADLQAIEQQAIQTAENISALETQYSSDQRDYMLFKSGADQSAEAIGGAMSYAKTTYDNSMVNAQAAYETKVESLKSRWSSGEVDNESYKTLKAKYDEELAAQKEAARTEFDGMLSEIFASTFDETTQGVFSDYDAIMQDIANATNEEGQVDLTALNETTMEILEANTALYEALGTVDAETFAQNTDRLLQPDALLQSMLNEHAAEDVDTTALATAYSVAFENGFFDGSKIFEANMNYSNIIAAVQTGLSSAIEKVDVTNDMDNSGEQVVKGFEKSLTSRAGRIYNAAKKLANRFVSAFNLNMEIHSPSRRMMRSGIYTAQGFEIGVTKSMESAISHVNRLVGKFNISPELDFSGITGAMTGAVNSIAETESSRDVVLMVNGRELARTQASNNKNAMAAYERQLALGVGAV